MQHRGIILILGLGCLATYTGFVIGQFKLKYPHVHNMADAGEIMLGPIGREVFGAAQIIFIVFVMGSHVLTFSIMMNTVTAHAACTIIFALVGSVLCFLCTIPRKLGDVSYMAVASYISIIAAVTITMVGVGVERPGTGEVNAVVQTSFYKGFLAVTNIIFAYAGHVAFFSFISELKKPEDYPKALFLLQGADTSMYVLVAIVIYCYAGERVTSPALGSTSPLLRKIAYGVAIPTIVIAGVINGHVAAKYIYVRLFRDTKHIRSNSSYSWSVWILITLVLWIVAWIIAEAIPVFNDLLGLISALFASWFTYGLSGVFWLFMNHGKYRKTRKKMFLTVLNSLTFLMGLTIVGSSLKIGRQAELTCMKVRFGALRLREVYRDRCQWAE